MRKRLSIGRWVVEFFFFTDKYDINAVLDSLYDMDADDYEIVSANRFMSSGEENTGFTYSNPRNRTATVVIGPASSGEEFLNTLVHEIYHLSVAIASELGVELDSETPAYLSGDTILELAEIVYLLGCPSR